MKWKIAKGDCFELIKKLPDNSIDLVLTSPPYSDIINYGNQVSTKKPDAYVDWILPLFNEIWRVLKPHGSFILNINDKCEGGYRSTYIYDLISRNNKETDLKLYDTYIWHKRNGIPNGGTRRFRNTTEFIFHFCKDAKQLKFNMDRVLQEHKSSSIGRYAYDMTNAQGEVIDGKRIKKKVKVRKGAMKCNENGLQDQEFSIRELPEKVRPDNVFRFSTAGASRDNLIKHPAPFHKELPLYFINLLTDEGDTVLDPFSGIATTGIAAKEIGRNYLGFELNETYADFSVKRLNDVLDEEWMVCQYTLQDEFVKSWKSASFAGKCLNLCSDDIMRCYSRNGFRTCGGFKWKLEKNIKHS